ncbi:MAG: hypothetical protein LC777_17530 [Actinobacteria bacterium]|nr:hypothetical protein [Actinomycetota bacterium]
MAYDPKKVMPAPPRYQPLENDPDDDPPPAYDDDDNNAPKFKDLVKVARRARKGLKDLKP